MTVKMLGTAFMQYATRGANYTADVNGTIAAVAVNDVLDMLQSGCIVASDSLSAATMSQFGAALGGANFNGFAGEGTIYKLIGAPIAANGADTTDDVLGGFVLPANSFDVAGRALEILIRGKHGATANNKQLKIWANPTLAGATTTAGVISGGTVTGAGTGVALFDSGTITGNNTGWEVLCNWMKYGAAGSNTQYAQVQKIFGTTHGGTSLPVATTIVETAAINIVITGASGTTGAAADIVLNAIQVRARN